MHRTGQRAFRVAAGPVALVDTIDDSATTGRTCDCDEVGRDESFALPVAATPDARKLRRGRSDRGAVLGDGERSRIVRVCDVVSRV